MVEMVENKHKGRDRINLGSEDEMEIWGFKRSPIRIVLVVILIIFSLGVLGLIFYWKPDWLLKCTSNRCSLEKADAILLKRYFFNKKLKYLWDEKQRKFESLKLPPITCSFMSSRCGLSPEQSQERYWLYGENFIRIRLTPILVLLITQGLTPFYIFQVFSILLWSAAESYYYYAGCIFVMSVISLIAQIVQERMMERGLKKTINNASTCRVARPDSSGIKYEEISSTDLVPGDVMMVPSDGCIMQCDAVLTRGTVIVNESMLTGFYS